MIFSDVMFQYDLKVDKGTYENNFEPRSISCAVSFLNQEFL